MMHYLTSRKLSDWGYDNGVISGNPPFFDHSDAKSYFTGVRQAKYKYAEQATWWAAHHVWCGRAVESAGPWETLPYRPDAPDIMSAYFLSSSDEPDGWQPEDFPSGFDTEILKEDGKRYDYWFEIPEEWEEDYLKALLFHLNLGVYYCAGVINHVKDSYTKCESGIEKELVQTIEQLKVGYTFLWAMSGMGHFALFLVFSQNVVSGLSDDKKSLLSAVLQIRR